MSRMAVIVVVCVIVVNLVVFILAIKSANFVIRIKNEPSICNLKNVGVRKVSEFIGCSPSLVLVWIKEFACNLRRELELAQSDLPIEQLPDIIEMDEIYTRVKKGLVERRYGLLFLDGSVGLLVF
jgi:hypothetical protein